MYLHPLIASLSHAERVALVQCSELRFYRRSETVLAAEDWTDGIYCVANGLLRVVAHGERTAQAGDVTTEFLRQDDFFLSCSLAEDRCQSKQTLIAALPSSVYVVPIAAVRALCDLYPEVAIGLLGMTMKRMSMMRSQLRRIAALSAEELVTRVLHQLTLLAPTSSGAYDKRITQSVIASYSGLSREVVNKTMRHLENRGLVRRDQLGVHVPDAFGATDFGGISSACAENMEGCPRSDQ